MTFFALDEHCYPWINHLAKIFASSQHSKYRHFGEYKLEDQYSLRRE